MLPELSKSMCIVGFSSLLRNGGIQLKSFATYAVAYEQNNVVTNVNVNRLIASDLSFMYIDPSLLRLVIDDSNDHNRIPRKFIV